MESFAGFASANIQLRFNSLRTGRGMERYDPLACASEFHAIVSIPYEREGAWKGIGNVEVSHLDDEVFQFPTNGKGHGKQDRNNPETVALVKFQFPTNGKGHGKSFFGNPDRLDLFAFQFPTNGKGHGKPEPSGGSVECIRCLFPFPTNGKGHGKHAAADIKGVMVVMFQFPTNGKGHGKRFRRCDLRCTVCFNSLRTGRGMERREIVLSLERNYDKGFNSLRTGRGMESAVIVPKEVAVFLFQFPTNGKGHGKSQRIDYYQSHVARFQFPTNGKGHGKWSRGWFGYLVV